MRNGIKGIFLAVLGFSLAHSGMAAEAKTELKDQKEKLSYSYGMNLGNSLKRAGIDVNVDIMAEAIKDVLAGRETKLTPQQAQEVQSSFQKEMMTKREAERQAKAEKNRAEGEKFLAENKKKEGVKVHSVTLPDGKVAELQYKVLNEGKGPLPKSNDMVKVNYKGTLINGTEFDSSAKHGGQPSTFSINGVIKGWTEALLMMHVGSKWQVFIPSALAYGDRGYGASIEPGATLIFEIELLNAEPAPAPAAVQPLTSDIIKVPSADELKKGAKIEVIKPEEVEKKIKEEEQKKKSGK